MDIVLPISFNNPNLPVVQRPGFRDDFNRPSANVLGTTTDGKPWTVHDYGSTTSVWGTYGDGTAGMKSASSARHVAVVDALTPDGTLTATFRTTDESARRPGLTLRAADADNYIQIAPIGATDHRMRILKMVDGTASNSPDLGPLLNNGTQISATCVGTTITVAVDGVDALTWDIPEFTNVTTHGMYAFSGAVGAWDGIEFTPA